MLPSTHPICDDGYHYQFFTMSSPFAVRTSVEGVEEEMFLAPKIEANWTIALTFTETTKTFEPATLYGDTPNPTQL